MDAVVTQVAVVTVVTVLAGVAGLLIGSFLNVVVARVPAGESVVAPASRCPRCAVPIEPRDNVPVLSWLVLRGRSRCCAEPISRRYPLVEAGTALAFAAVTWWVLTRSASPTWPLAGRSLPDPAVVLALLALLLLAAVSIALALIDIDTRRLPFWIVTPATGIAALLVIGSAVLTGSVPTVVRVLVGAGLLWGMYRLLHLVYPAGMGYGDVRMSAMLGGYLAWFGYGELAVGAFAGFLLGSVGGVALMALRNVGRKGMIPFGPYMLAGTWVGLVVGDPLFHSYLRASGI